MPRAPVGNQAELSARVVRGGTPSEYGANVWSGIVRFALAWILLAVTSGRLVAQSQRLSAEAVLSMMRQGVTESRIVVLIVQSCVIDGNDRAQRVLRAGGASETVLRAAARASCEPDEVRQAPPEPRRAPPARASTANGPHGMHFVLIPPGSFRMGSTAGDGDEQPVHIVNISRAFELQTTEVTQGQWAAVMGSNPSRFSSCGPTCPVESVSWDDVQVFIARLNQAYPGVTYRLPTEAEWEYAARAGTTGEFGGTGVPDQMGWTDPNPGGRTHPVAQKAPNAWGLYDMHGNVWEWVQDRYSASYYSVSPANDPLGPAAGSVRVLRGGSWYSVHQRAVGLPERQLAVHPLPQRRVPFSEDPVALCPLPSCHLQHQLRTRSLVETWRCYWALAGACRSSGPSQATHPDLHPPVEVS